MLRALTVLAATALLASHAGAVLPAADALAVGRPQLALATLAGGLLLAWRGGARRAGIAAAVLAIVAAVPMVAAFLPPAALPGTAKAGAGAAAAEVRLYQKNLLAVAWPRAPLAEEIAASGAQVVTLQEVSDHNHHYMAAMWQAYPTQHRCETGHRGAVAILSHWPAVPGSAACGPGFALLQLDRPGAAAVWVMSVHLSWPWPAGPQAAEARAIADLIGTLDGPVIVAGDFNMQPWGASVRRLARAAGARAARPARLTYPAGLPLLPLAIDHVLLPEGWAARAAARPRHGSDHRGLLVTIRPRG